MSVTMQTIADELGIDRSAVSRALAGKADRIGLSASRVDQIRQAASRLGYRPNSAARATRQGRYGAIGVLMSTNGKHSVLNHIVNGLQEAANRLRLAVRFCAMPDDQIDDEHIQRLMDELCVDGVLVNYTHEFPPRLAELLETNRIPAVWVNVKRDHDCVRVDDFGAGGLAIEWLIDRGHRRIGYVTLQPRPDMHYSIVDRRDGYIRAVIDAGLKPDALEYAQHLANAPRDAQLVQWLDRPDRPTAVYAQTIAEAEAVYVAAARLNLTVPDDLSILTSHHEGMQGAGVQLDALQIPTIAVGRRAVDYLHERINRPGRPMPAEALPYYFGEYRAWSTGPPRDKP